jgi:hypothetical protein
MTASAGGAHRQFEPFLDQRPKANNPDLIGGSLVPARVPQ